MKGPTSPAVRAVRLLRGPGRQRSGTLDVIGMDAATHGLVDDARNCAGRPCSSAQSRYQRSIIDGAHQLGPGAANALLKLIEEPPSMCGSLFATTEPDGSSDHSQPDPSLRLRLVPVRTLATHLAGVCEAKVFRPNRPPWHWWRAPAGSVRDAMSILGQLVSGTVRGASPTRSRSATRRDRLGIARRRDRRDRRR